MSTSESTLWKLIPFDLKSLSILLCCYGIVILACLLGTAVYNIYFHPLAKYPGPKLAAATRLVHVRWLISGRLPFIIKDLHDQYGDVVRIAPDELTYRDAPAWTGIYGQHAPKGKNFEKDVRGYNPPVNGIDGVLTAKGQEHSRHRRVLAHGFSDRSLREQEPGLKSYTDLLIRRLYSQVSGDAKGVVDISKWYNYTTFDMMGDFAFGESFNCLENNNYHPWVEMIFSSVKAGNLLVAENHFPSVASLVKALIMPKGLIEKRRQNYLLAKEKVGRRLALTTDRVDIISFMTRDTNPHKLPMSKPEIETNASLVIMAGSETTANLLTGVSFQLLQNPEIYKNLTQEIRGSFAASEEIGLNATANLPYLQAVIEETLRIYPPVASGLPRVVPEGGAFISDRFVPEGTAVSVTHWSANQSSSNFAQPKSFIPERWLEGNSRFASDKRDARQPFSVGPRNCIGKAMAYAKARLILAKVLWHFDLKLCVDLTEWSDQKVYVAWEKKPLMLKLVPVQPESSI
ncbi:hypothetical protein FQN54_009676 [Arachnomyces sp. PD_36]|nr:hypothetical protein FQN54_009676 [Arachnomyces sp. PD_36]